MLSSEEAENWKDFVPEKITFSAALFFSEQNRIEGLRWYFLASDTLLKNNLDSVKDNFITLFQNANHEVTDILAQNMDQNAKNIFDSTSYQVTIGQMIYSRAVDNFITYLKDLLAEIVNSKPEILKSKEKESRDFILSFDSLDDLKSAIAEKKIETLFYGGIKDIVDFFNNTLGFELFSDQQQFEKAQLSTKLRNLIVHNRGRVNNQFLKEFPNYEYEEGELLTFEWQDISEIDLFFQRIIKRIDSAMAEKFDLELYDNFPEIDERLK
ncbi:hypothetical protein NC796_25080 [Aliifodinibius sp. S!AR15-10]|uniref:hypothetical protein n=1 Tax=Aliifodinibius sp. S!AR15-10 TaxID=2950437 RepID=UPI0028633141|nr:hypothetical protein [Aliifodinibius sp. S!AR15-10]MDR8394444.1 hypothetical protein [Aliifodinibius sp. S!AR15-10]